jgi:hypothetical protein
MEGFCGSACECSKGAEWGGQKETNKPRRRVASKKKKGKGGKQTNKQTNKQTKKPRRREANKHKRKTR